MSLGRKKRLVRVCAAASKNVPFENVRLLARRSVRHRTGLPGLPGSSTPFTFLPAID